jgi:hypothetical protein
VYALMISCRPLKSFSEYNPTTAFFYVSLKLVTYFENAYLNPPQISLLCHWSMFSSFGPSLAAWKMRKIQWSQAAFSIILQEYSRLPVCIFRVKRTL